MRSSDSVLRRTEGVKWMSFTLLESYPFVLHGFTLSDRSLSPQVRQAKLERFFQKIDSKERKLVSLAQRHQDECVFINSGDIVKSEYRGDALLTDRDDIFISVSVADCLPIFLLDQRRKVIGLVHAGWRGTLLGIARSSMEMARHRLRCDPADFTALFGPCIRRCCYRVSEDVGVLFRKECTDRCADGRLVLDLVAANMKQLAAGGVKEDKMFHVDRCTCCHREQFSSYRREGNNTAKMIAFMGLRRR